MWRPLLILFIFIATTRTALAEEEIVFSSGGPLDQFQQRIIIPLLSEAFSRNGFHFSAVPYPSMRSLQLSNSGAVDGELARVYNFHEVSGGKYPNLVRIDATLMTLHLAAFATDPNTQIAILEDIHGQRFGLRRGRLSLIRLIRERVKSEPTLVSSDLAAFRMLAKGRFDVILSESELGQGIIESSKAFEGIIEVGKLDYVELYAYMNIKHRSLASRIADTLPAMKEDGSFSKILEESAHKYFVDLQKQ